MTTHQTSEGPEPAAKSPANSIATLSQFSFAKQMAADHSLPEQRPPVEGGTLDPTAVADG
jgi:hypothetical protein